MSSRKLASKETFAIAAPQAQEVALVGSFSRWEQQPIQLKKSKAGTWKATVALEPGKYEYRFLVDGKWANDPSCEIRVPNPFGEENCLRIVAC